MITSMGSKLKRKLTRPKRAKGRGRETRIYRWCEYRMPIRDGEDALQVWWFDMEVRYKGKTTYRNSFVTSIEPKSTNIVALANSARARWKIENESFNILKNNGYNMEHNFGHGEKGLSNLLLTLNLIAFAFHTVCDQVCTLWKQSPQPHLQTPAFLHHADGAQRLHLLCQLGTTADAARTAPALDTPTTAGCRTRPPSLNIY